MRWIIFYFLLMAANSFAQKQFCEEKLWKITLPNFPAPQYQDTEEWKYQIYAQPNYKFMDYPYSTLEFFDSVELTMVLNELDTLYFPKISYDHNSYLGYSAFIHSALQIYIPKNQSNKAIIIERFITDGGKKIGTYTLQLKQHIADTLRLKAWINKQPTLCRTFIEQKQIRLYPMLMTNPKNDDAYAFCSYLGLETPCLDLDVELAYKKEYDAYSDSLKKVNHYESIYRHIQIEAP